MRWPAAALIVGLLAILVGCDMPPEPGKGRLPEVGEVIAIVGPPRPDPYWAGVLGGAREKLARGGVLRLVVAVPSDNTEAALLTAIDEVLAQKPRVVCLSSDERPAISAGLERIRAAGLPVVTFGPGDRPKAAFGHVQIDLTGAAVTLADNLVAIAGGKRSYVLLHAASASPMDKRVYERFLQSVRSGRSLVLLQEHDIGAAGADAKSLLRESQRRFPSLGLIVALDADTWGREGLGAVLAPDRSYAAVGAPPSLWSDLPRGRARALVGWLDGDVGAAVIDLATTAITESRRPGITRSVPAELITAENVADYARRYAEAVGLTVEALAPGLKVESATQPVTP